MPIRRIIADLAELFTDAPFVVLDADAAAGATSITVQSIIGVSTNDILFFREPGNEKAEIIATHASTSPSGNTVTLVAAGLVEAHPAGTKVYIIQANQVRFYNAATEIDANSTEVGVTALAAAQNIDPTLIRNIYDDSVSTSGFYYYRFSDSINSVNLLYSDPIPWLQVAPAFSQNEVGYIIERARKDLGLNWSQTFSKQDAIEEVNACLRFSEGKLKRWARYLTPDYALGQTARGVFSYTLPTDIYDNQTNKSILQVRMLGASAGTTLVWKDEKEFDGLMGEAKRTTVRVTAVVGATTLDIVNSYDFDSDGTVHVSTSNTVDTITYTGVTRSTTAGVLTGVPATGTGAIGAAHAVGVNVWQDEDEGRPLYFNVRNGALRIWPLPNSTFVNKNIFLDYYTQATSVDSESDAIDVDRYDMVLYWLKWKMRSVIKKGGVLDLKDGDYLMFRDILSQQIRTSISGQKSKWVPKLNQITYRPIRPLSENFDRS